MDLRAIAHRDLGLTVGDETTNRLDHAQVDTADGAADGQRGSHAVRAHRTRLAHHFGKHRRLFDHIPHAQLAGAGRRGEGDVGGVDASGRGRQHARQGRRLRTEDRGRERVRQVAVVDVLRHGGRATGTHRTHHIRAGGARQPTNGLRCAAAGARGDRLTCEVQQAAELQQVLVYFRRDADRQVRLRRFDAGRITERIDRQHARQIARGLGLGDGRVDDDARRVEAAVARIAVTVVRNHARFERGQRRVAGVDPDVLTIDRTSIDQVVEHQHHGGVARDHRIGRRFHRLIQALVRHQDQVLIQGAEDRVVLGRASGVQDAHRGTVRHRVGADLVIGAREDVLTHDVVAVL